MKVQKAFKLHLYGGENLISDAFGLSEGMEIAICNLNTPDDYKIMLITGESGSGKTTILRELFPRTETAAHNGKPLFLWAGDSYQNQIDCVSVLSCCGLSDATQLVSTYEQLSDSQKARADIAFQIINGTSDIVVDEFLSTLDRDTAKAVAYCMQKYIRRTNRRLIVATAHDDLAKYLRPDIVIKGKSYPSRFTVERNSWIDSEFPWVVTMRYGTKMDYRNCSLGDLHYKGKYTGGAKEYLFAYINEDIVGVLLATYNRASGGRRISRLVVHPSYRGIGIGRMLVEKYIHDYPNTDVVAAMGRFNPVFERAGMQRLQDSVIKSPKGLRKSLCSLGFDTAKWHDKSYCLTQASKRCVRDLVANFYKEAADLICPGGAYLPLEAVRSKIENEPATAGRVLFFLRDREMARFAASGYCLESGRKKSEVYKG